MNQDRIKTRLAPAGREAELNGMEALVRGLLESGVTYATGYSGGPASVDKALLPVLESAGPACGLRFEWSVNEAVLAAKVLGRATLTHSRGLRLYEEHRPERRPGRPVHHVDQIHVQ